MAKLTSYDSGKWYSAKRATEFQDLANKVVPQIFTATKSGDTMGAMKLKQDLENKMALLKIIDRDEEQLAKADTRSVNTKQAQEEYNKSGVKGLVEHNQKYWFAPLAQVDESTGDFKLINVPNPNLDKNLKRVIDAKMAAVAPKDKGGYFQIDVNSDGYKKAKAEALNDVLGNEELFKGVINTRDFKVSYEDYLAKNKINPNEADELDLEDAYADYINKKYSENESLKVKTYVPKSSSGGSTNATYFVGGKNSGRWNFTKVGDGTTKIDVPGNTDASPILTGKGLDGSVYNIEVKLPEIKYNGDGTFTVNGLEKNILGKLVPMKPMIITKKELENKFGLTEQGIAANFDGYKSSSAKPAPKKEVKSKVIIVNGKEIRPRGSK